VTRRAAAAPAQSLSLPFIALLIAAPSACSRRPPITACDQDLAGIWRDGERRWMVLDRGQTLEIFPTFPDADSGSAHVDAAPRVIDLTRTGARLDGFVGRRYSQGIAMCDARIPLHITRCTDDTLELVLTDPAPPLSFAPCLWPPRAPSHVEHWTRR
jgi:hypothetical protein